MDKFTLEGRPDSWRYIWQRQVILSLSSSPLYDTYTRNTGLLPPTCQFSEQIPNRTRNTSLFQQVWIKALQTQSWVTSMITALSSALPDVETLLNVNPWIWIEPRIYWWCETYDHGNGPAQRQVQRPDASRCKNIMGKAPWCNIWCKKVEINHTLTNTTIKQQSHKIWRHTGPETSQGNKVAVGDS